jgi:hypothetical protein
MLHDYVYDPVPPEATTLALPSDPPAHEIATELKAACTAVGSVTNIYAELLQLFASVIVTV